MSRFRVQILCNLLMLVVSIGYVSLNAEENTVKEEQKSQKRIIEDPNFSTFAMAVKAGGISDLFNGTGPFTAFIPSNAAFEKFGKGKLDELLKPENKDRLVDILIYHIVPGKYMAENLKSKEYRTVNGKTISVTVAEGDIKVDNAKVTRKNLVGINGVAHEIDTVLIPQ